MLSKPNFMPPTQGFKGGDLEEMWEITDNFFFFLWIKKIDICFSKATLNNVNKSHFLQFPLIKRP